MVVVQILWHTELSRCRVLFAKYPRTVVSACCCPEPLRVLVFNLNISVHGETHTVVWCVKRLSSRRPTFITGTWSQVCYITGNCLRRFSAPVSMRKITVAYCIILLARHIIISMPGLEA